MSNIEWTDITWNPVTGCTKISPGCANCYAERMSKRVAGRWGYPKDDPFAVVTWAERLRQPIKLFKPKKIFVNSMSDLFHEEVPDKFIKAVFSVMAYCKRHTFQVLTKRPERMLKFLQDNSKYQNLPNVWLGVSVEDQERVIERIPLLLQTPAAVRFVSLEPLLGRVNLYSIDCNNYIIDALKGFVYWLGGGRANTKLDLVIVGGESGPGARPMHPEWVRSLRDQCQNAGVPFFFKQWGAWVETDNGIFPGDICLSPNGCFEVADKGYVCFSNESEGTVMRRLTKKKAGRMLDGRTWDEIPEIV